MKNLIKNNSKLLLIITLLETILSIYFLIYLGYVDRLNYIESSTITLHDLTLLIQNMYTSTWWALIITLIILISIFTITSIIYKKNYVELFKRQRLVYMPQELRFSCSCQLYQ